MKKVILIMILLAVATVALTACTEPADNNSFTVTFVDSTLGAVTYEKGQSIAEPAAPEREGYFFRGWYADTDCTISFDFEAVRNEDVSVYAKWAATRFEVLFANTEIELMVYNYGEKIQIPDEPLKEGFLFGGWYADAAYTVEFDFNANCYENVTIYAKWDNLPPIVFTFVSLTEYFGDNISGTYDGYLTDLEGNLLDGYAVTEVTINEMIDIVIPDQYNGKPVYVLGAGLFEGEDIINVTIPSSIVVIDSAAFKNCSQLEQVSYAAVSDDTVPYGWKIMDVIAAAQIPVDPEEITNPVIFANMQAVNDIYLTCSRLCMIGNQVFYGCSSIEELTLPPMLLLMGEDSFYECKELVTVYVQHRNDWRTSDGPGPCWMGTHGFANLFAGCMRLESIYVYLYNGNAPVYNDPLPQGVLTGVDVYKQHPYWNMYASYIKAHPSGN